MDRRSFLKASAAVIASTAIPAIAGVTQPAVSPGGAIPEFIQEFLDPHWKYKEALRMYDEVVSAKKFPYILYPRFDKLMEFVHTNFKEPEFNDENRALTKEILRAGATPELMEKFRKVPPEIQEAVWPIVMMIGLLRWEAIPFQYRQLTQFTAFHNRYGRFILDY